MLTSEFKFKYEKRAKMRNAVRKEKELGKLSAGNLKITYQRELESCLRKGHMKREVNLLYIYDSEKTSKPK